MPPKGSTSAKKSGAAPSHGSYQDMIKEAILNLKDRTGSSRQALKKYVQANNNLGGTTDAQFTSQFNKALAKGSDSGVFDRPKGPSGPVKLAAPGKKAAAEKPAAAKVEKATKAPAKAKATKAKTATKKAPAKSATKKTTAKSTTTKKTAATKTKANTSKPRKTAAPAPAVEDKAPVVLGKTKSGRVTKSKAPQPVKKAIASKKKAAAKKATPKKTATPKKA